ncbi:RsmB/NOP family class I SAM-dependent RNA methyltransferase [Frigidibacter sp. MR17.14]|uniref:RsmB/NOP family class I SAM-dependent RNA methyltransferase n=1 Tax=Frigidibacter sp. MR17.14 TaxID=3126509 RepID=UPI003012F9E8
MTPAARLAAAIEILDRQRAGEPAEKALTLWARTHRFAGSGDRAAIRDHVFAALRAPRSQGARGGGSQDGRASGRQLVLGGLVAAGIDPDTLFTGEGHAPAALTPAERASLDAVPAELPEAVALDCPDWLAGPLRDSLGTGFAPVMALLRERAPVFARANLARGPREAAIAALEAEGIAAHPHPLAATAIELTGNAARLRTAAPYLDGRVELQDAASQAVVEMLPLPAGGEILDYCAGGGGKALAMAARGAARLTAHDIDAGRMRDLPERARRAGARIALARPGSLGGRRFDLVLADVPCSGSGSWRRAPEAKWTLTPARLAELTALQAEILDEVAALVRPGGVLGYATCSMLEAENGAQVAAFLARRPGWRLEAERGFTPLDGGDGFYAAVLRAPAA